MEHQSEYEIWKAPDCSFHKVIITKGFGFNTPQDGSHCKVQIMSDEHSLIQPLDSDMTKDVIIGEADTDLDKVLEACVSTMKEEEICELVITEPLPPDDTDEALSPSPNEENKVMTESDNTKKCEEDENNDGNVHNVEGETNDDAATIEIQNLEEEPAIKVKLQLLCYTREPEIWEMSITEKWRRASHHKVKGVELFTPGKYKWAFRRFSQSLQYIISLEHDIPPEHNLHEQGMDIKGLKVSCYLNLAACQLKNHNYSSVIKNCTKALELDADNLKALYRRGVAFIHVQEYERSKEDLDRVCELEPDHPTVAKHQQALKARVQKLDAHYANAMKKMFS